MRRLFTAVCTLTSYWLNTETQLANTDLKLNSETVSYNISKILFSRYFNSEAYRNGKPTQDSLAPSRPFEADPNVYFDEPINLNMWVKQNKDEIKFGSYFKWLTYFQ